MYHDEARRLLRGVNVCRDTGGARLQDVNLKLQGVAAPLGRFALGSQRRGLPRQIGVVGAQLRSFPGTALGLQQPRAHRDLAVLRQPQRRLHRKQSSTSFADMTFARGIYRLWVQRTFTDSVAAPADLFPGKAKGQVQ